MIRRPWFTKLEIQYEDVIPSPDVYAFQAFVYSTMLYSIPIFILAPDSSISDMNKAFTLFSLSIIIFYGIYGQHTTKIEKVMYDPLLWKRTMKLTQSQCDEITRINISFYQLL